MVDKDKGNLGAKVFYIWGGLCAIAVVYTWALVPETKGLTLEQVDKMLEETTPRSSAKWTPHNTYAAEMGVIKARGPEPSSEDSYDYGDEKISREEHVDAGGSSKTLFLRVL